MRVAKLTETQTLKRKGSSQVHAETILAFQNPKILRVLILTRDLRAQSWIKMEDELGEVVRVAKLTKMQSQGEGGFPLPAKFLVPSEVPDASEPSILESVMDTVPPSPVSQQVWPLKRCLTGWSPFAQAP